MSITGVIYGLPSLPYLHATCTCSTCVHAKQTREHIPKHSSTPTSCPFQIMHSDVWGSAQIPSLTRLRYVLTFTDDFTRFTWVYLRTKDEVIVNFKDLHAIEGESPLSKQIMEGSIYHMNSLPSISFKGSITSSPTPTLCIRMAFPRGKIARL